MHTMYSRPSSSFLLITLHMYTDPAFAKLLTIMYGRLQLSPYLLFTGIYRVGVSLQLDELIALIIETI